MNKKSASSSIFKLFSNNCGRLSVSIKNFFVGDLLGIFYFPVKIEEKNLYIDVLPDIEPMNLDMDKNFPGEFLKADDYLEKVLAVSSGLLEKDCFHMVVYYDAVSGCIQRVKIEKEDHIYELTDHLFQILPYEKEIDLEEIYHLEYPQHEYSISYLLNMHMELWEGGGFSCGREKKLL